ncbi:hypothetical protein ACFWQC_09740 [Nocardioides sp. NPDC058538]|uniref:hypothetical protein n=1 Tax=Nocardioides sp. NPDC058538 TaxID=3346542 RepID=UPI00364B0AA6
MSETEFSGVMDPGASPNRSGDPGRGLRAVAALPLAMAWGALIRGLYFLTPTSDPMLDLEAGHGFAVTVDVYLPSMLLGCLVLVGIPLMFLNGVGTVMGIISAVGTGLFAVWVARSDQLLNYLPGLGTALLITGALSALALMLVLGAVGLNAQEPANPAATASRARVVRTSPRMPG